jgi:outer membrane protein assembly factor BamB
MRLTTGIGLVAVLAGAVILGACGKVAETEPRVPQAAFVPATQRVSAASFEVDRDSRRVIARDGKGGILWIGELEGAVGGVRDPHLAHDSTRVYVSNAHGVTALDARTGNLLWHSKGPSDRLLISGEIVLAAECGSDDAMKERLLVARSVKDGREVFRTQLPVKRFDPLPVEEVAGLFLVQIWDWPGGSGKALLVDRKGMVWHEFERQVVDGVKVGDNRIFLTSKTIESLSPDGKVLWSKDFPSREWIAGGALLKLPDGTFLAHLFGQISDSGVQLIRIDPAEGKVLWRTRCDPLLVKHSAYSHSATATLKARLIVVRSVGSSGVFTETLDLDTGKQLKRDVR